MLPLVAVGCSIPVGGRDLRLVPSVRSDELATTGFSAGGDIMGLQLGLSMGSRCTGLVSGIDGDARCLGIGVQPKEEERAQEPAEAQPPVLASDRGDGRQYIEAVPKIDDTKKERGVSASVNLLGLGAGVSASGSCVGATAAVDGEGRCLGVGLRPRDDATAAAAPSRTERARR